MALLEAKNITKDFISGNRTVKAVNDITIKIEKGEMVAVTGPSGAGKSTFLQLCAGLMKPTNGKVILDGKDLYAMSRDDLAEFRRNHISYIFQHFNLLPMLTAQENIAVPSLLNDIKPEDGKLRAITDSLGITDRLEHFPFEMSGGEQQRVAIARALINDPQCIFADEPTGNLDRKSTRDVMDLFSRLNKDGRTIVIVTHDPEVAGYCSRIISIVDGKTN
ncbi:MAG: ABC transporter ATP-binding protein [Clostridia bacterium]|nr:ABC transporter ATP-binding protein [Clostridia bacterium]